MFYDYFLTLPEEVLEMWKGNVTLAKLLFYANRYSALFYEIFVTMHLFYKANDEVSIAISLAKSF